MDTRKNTQKSSILVIDDEEVVRLLFQSLLEEEGHQAYLAENGRQGVELLVKHAPPLVLVDKNLPDISGLDLIAEQKQKHPNTEFIMITGYASLDSAVKAMEMGAFSYLTKPFSDMDVVMDRIRAALEVNTLRHETSLLRDRLSTITGGTAQPAPANRGPDVAVRDQLQRTLRILESFAAKRDQPPSASLWARMIDMIEDEATRIKKLMQANNARG